MIKYFIVNHNRNTFYDTSIGTPLFPLSMYNVNGFPSSFKSLPVYGLGVIKGHIPLVHYHRRRLNILSICHWNTWKTFSLTDFEQ